MQYLFIFLGGAVGALLRYLLSFVNTSFEMPIGTLLQIYAVHFDGVSWHSSYQYTIILLKKVSQQAL